MEMEGVLNGTYDTPTACRLALEAGNDMILISHSPPTQEKTWQALRKAMRESPFFASTVRESARRIVETKLRWLRDDGNGGFEDPRKAAPGGTPQPGVIRAPIPAEGAPDFFFQSSCRDVSIVSRKRIPFAPAAGEKILLCGQFSEFLDEGKVRYPRADTLLFPFSPFYKSRREDRSRVEALAARYDEVIFCLANFNSLEVLQALKTAARKLIVVSTLTPVYLREAPWVETAVAVFGSGRDSFRAGFAALRGDYEPSASVPLYFDLPRRPRVGK
jgi:beta-N-acetylhexosaminidase